MIPGVRPKSAGDPGKPRASGDDPKRVAMLELSRE